MQISPIFADSICRFAAMLLSAQLCFAQGGRSSISGYVFDPAKRPVSQVVVELKNEFSIVARITTDGSGRFYFTGLGHGRYTIVAKPLGTNLMQQSVEIELAGMGSRGQSIPDNQQKDIYLRPRPGAEAVPFQNVVVFAQDVPKEAEDQYKRGMDDLASQRVPSGIQALERAVAIFPDYFMALQQLGIVRLTQEDFSGAIETFSKALKINDRCFDCWYGVAYGKYSLSRFGEAAEASVKAAGIKPESVEANLLAGMTYRSLKDTAKAEQYLKAAAKAANGSSADVHWQLALLYGRDSDRYAEAAKELEAYLKASPDAPNKEDIKKLIKQFKDKAKARS